MHAMDMNNTTNVLSDINELLIIRSFLVLYHGYYFMLKKYALWTITSTVPTYHYAIYANTGQTVKKRVNILQPKMLNENK